MKFSIKKCFKNIKLINEFIGLIFKFSKKFVVINIMIMVVGILNTLINILFTNYLLSIVFEGIQLGKVIMSITVIMLILIILNFLNIFLEKKYLNLSTVGLVDKFKTLLFEKISQEQYKEYLNESFYEKVKFVFEQGNMRIIEVFNIIIQCLNSVIMIAMFGSIIIVYEPGIILLIVTEVIVSTIISMKISKVNFNKNKKIIIPIKRQSYFERIFYIFDYSKEVRIFPELKKTVLKKFEKATKDKIEIHKDYLKKEITYSFFQTCFSSFVTALIVIYLLIAIYRKRLDSSSFYLIYASSNQVITVLINLFLTIPKLYENSLYLKEIHEILAIKNEVLNNIKQKIEKIKVSNLYYKYSKDADWLIENLSFELKIGDCLGIKGSNGTGKSTLIALLSGLLLPSSGTIEIIFENGKKIPAHQYNRSKLRVLFQDFNTYCFSIFENLLSSGAKSEIDYHSLLKIYTFVDMDKKINSLHLKEKTNLGNEVFQGIELSGGEKQRLGIARAFTDSPTIVLLDEPFNHLDIDIKKKILKRIQGEVSNKICLIVAHNEEEFQICNQILELPSNKIINTLIYK